VFHWRIVACSVLCILLDASVGLDGQTKVWAQAGLKDALIRLDRNGNGKLEIDEITAQSRPFLERVARARRLSMDRVHDLQTWQDAARAYFALQNGIDDRRVRPEREGAIRGFEPDRSEPVIPEFGLAEIKYPYTEEDLREARRTLNRHDRNRDGYLDRNEVRNAEWTHSDPFDSDLDGDDRLSRLELAQRYARRRLLQNSSQELLDRFLAERQTRNDRDRRQDSNDDNDWRRWRRGGSETWLAGSIMQRFDSNRDGQLTEDEAASLGVAFGLIDIDRDGRLSRSELQQYVVTLQQESGADAGAGLPGWFYERDLDRDGQVSMAEYTDDWTEEAFEAFTRLDLNNDGLLTASEVLQSKGLIGGSFTNDKAEVIPPQRTIISEIEIQDDLWIRDLDVILSITHTRVGHLDAFLTGPDGQRIELFTDVGGDGDNFNNTRFDDQSSRPIFKHQAPFEGSYQPEGLSRGGPGLSKFNGKNAKGVWQLAIRGTRSDRFGMLHEWSLVIQPEERE
jgi:Ca2+-binding EF-hand superfamily protein/subtilisin-like proprotein convertase family protein